MDCTNGRAGHADLQKCNFLSGRLGPSEHETVELKGGPGQHQVALERTSRRRRTAINPVTVVGGGGWPTPFATERGGPCGRRHASSCSLERVCQTGAGLEVSCCTAAPHRTAKHSTARRPVREPADHGERTVGNGQWAAERVAASGPSGKSALAELVGELGCRECRAVIVSLCGLERHSLLGERTGASLLSVG